MASTRGTAGYAAHAGQFFAHVDNVEFADVHRPVLHLLPAEPCHILDIGAGTGRDAAAFAAAGHQVVAVEPTAELRERARATHGSPRITWLDDSLPLLSRLQPHGAPFDLIMLTAVWMHLDAKERALAMPVVACLLRDGGQVIFSLRRGPVPAGRVMYDVTADETIDLAASAGLEVLLHVPDQPSALPRADVTGARLVFRRPRRGLR